MNEFLATVLSPPTVIYTALLGVMLLYWLSVLVGALDIDLFDPGALDAADGAADGALEGLLGLLSAAKLRYAPVTVVLSFASLFAWLGSYFGDRYLSGALPLPEWASASIVGVASLLVALPLTSLVTRPLAPLFKTHAARNNAELVGKIVVVKTGDVNDRFGQAELHDKRGALLVHVRCDEPQRLKKGDRALIIGWNEERGAFEVEPAEDFLPESAKGKQARRR